MSRAMVRWQQWCLMVAVLMGVGVRQVLADSPAKAEPPKIQIAVLLDTSSSMSGLINQARVEIWRMVNEFSKSSLGGTRPRLEVALFEYGNDRLPPTEGYIRQVVPFTENLDVLSRELFALTTNGGSEFCGWVIDDAVRTLAWHDSPRDLRCIFIAGNEPFTQGPRDYKAACKAAAAKGITVTTIHCGDEATGIATGWRDGALLADGSYLNINHNQVVAELPTPHDKVLVELSAKLNVTYVPYGDAKKQAAAVQNQVAQDSNSVASGSAAAATRASAKATGLYRNLEWDVVDACREGKIKLEDLKTEDLPAELRSLSLAERKKYIDQKLQARIAIQAEIKTLSETREKYLVEARAKAAATAASPQTLGDAVLKSVREQGQRKSYKFDP